MKKFMLVFVLALLLVATTTAFAAGGQPVNRGRSPFELTGTITAIDGSTVTVKVVSANRLVKSFIGKEVPVLTSETTTFLLKNADGTTSVISLADLAVGQNVSVGGKLTTDGLQATRITVGAKLLHLP